jgi:hypothetical protein
MKKAVAELPGEKFASLAGEKFPLHSLIPVGQILTQRAQSIPVSIAPTCPGPDGGKVAGVCLSSHFPLGRGNPDRWVFQW